VEAAQVTDLPKRLRPEPARRAAIGSQRDLRVLSELGWAGVLTTGQVERLAFPSRRRAQRRLRAYLDAGLVRAQLQAEAMHRDNLWTLTSTGIEFVRERATNADDLRPFRVNVRSQKLGHALFVRDIAVSFLVAERRGLLILRDLRLDSELANGPAFRQLGLIPDGLAAVDQGGGSLLVLWEVASDAQPLAQVRTKLIAYDRAFGTGPEFFRRSKLGVIVALERDARLARLAKDASRLAHANRFRFAVVKDLLEPERLLSTIASLRETASSAATAGASRARG
jgi:hypothetical protein